MAPVPPPPDTFAEFCQRFPKVAQAWQLVGEAGRGWPLDEKSGRLVKLAVSIGALREGAVHSAVRKAVAAGASREEIDQVLALAVSTIGFPAAVAAYTWVRDCLDRPE